MPKLNVYLYEGSYQMNSYSLETGTEDVAENIRIAKEITADDIESAIRYRKTLNIMGYWAEIEVPNYGKIRVKYDNGFSYWDLVKNSSSTWVPFDFLEYTDSIIK
jgi:hypothetical protein